MSKTNGQPFADRANHYHWLAELSQHSIRKTSLASANERRIIGPLRVLSRLFYVYFVLRLW
jgi:hypothetical protein